MSGMSIDTNQDAINRALSWDFKRTGYQLQIKDYFQAIEKASVAQVAITSASLEVARIFDPSLNIRPAREANEPILTIIGQYKADQHLYDISSSAAAAVARTKKLNTLGHHNDSLTNAYLIQDHDHRGASSTSSSHQGKKSGGGKKKGRKPAKV